MIRRAFFVLVTALSISSLTLQAGSTPSAREVGDGDHAERHRLTDRFRGHQERRQRHRCRGRDRIRAWPSRIRPPAISAAAASSSIGPPPASRRPTTSAKSAPSRSSPEMWLTDGKYDFEKHHNSHLRGGRARHGGGTAPGVEGCGHRSRGRSWSSRRSSWRATASKSRTASRDRSPRMLDDFQKYPASLAQFSKNGKPYEAGEILKQPDLARTLTRIAEQGPAGFYEGDIAALIEKEMKANGGLITMADLKAYQAKKRARGQGHVSRLRRDRHAAAELGRHGGGPDAERARRLRPQGQRLRIGEEHSPHRGSDAPRVRRSRAISRRSGFREGHPAADADLEGLRRRACARRSIPTRRRSRRPTRSRGPASHRRPRTCRSSTPSATRWR